jgi:hypothetical protein
MLDTECSLPDSLEKPAIYGIAKVKNSWAVWKDSESLTTYLDCGEWKYCTEVVEGDRLLHREHSFGKAQQADENMIPQGLFGNRNRKDLYFCGRKCADIFLKIAEVFWTDAPTESRGVSLEVPLTQA